MKKFEDFNKNEYLSEKFDANLKKALKDHGVEDKKELRELVKIAKKGELSHYLREKGDTFTFGMLNAIFKDSLRAKKSTDIKVGAYKMIHRIVPLALAPFFPVVAIVGHVLGTSRAVNKILMPVIKDPGNHYQGFLKKMIDSSIKVTEGELPAKDRFSRAFVISDQFSNCIRPEILHKFSLKLSDEMSRKDPEEEVPHYYIENELKKYINEKFNVEPKIPLK